MLTRWDPFADINRIHRTFFRPNSMESDIDFRPSVDIVEDEKNVSLKVDIAGVDPDDIKIGLENGVLTVSGERKLEKKEEKDGYHRVERAYGSFSRSFVLPDNLDGEGVDANYKDGILTVSLPKNEEAKRKEIKVTTH